MGGNEIKQAIAATVARIPEWVRHDLAAKDLAARNRAEETLAAILLAAIRDDPQDQAA